MERIDLARKLAAFEDTWKPRVVAELNGQQVKLVKLEGEFVWHSHEHEDELFWVLSGTLELHFRDRVVELEPGQLIVVPRGVEHKPVARGPVACALFEPATTRSTGAVDDARTVEPDELERL